MNDVRKRSMEELGRMEKEAFKKVLKSDVVLVLDSVRSLHNVGSIFRTADAFRVKAIFLCGITGTPPHREILKTALGATETVDWKYVPNVVDAISTLKASGFKISALEQTSHSAVLGKIPLNDAPRAFILGNEVDGVSDEALACCHEFIEIPQFGTKHSFNVSVSAGILLWEWWRGQ